MERNAITELEQLIINNKSRNYLKEIAKWSFFLSIVGFVGIAFMLVLAIFAGFIFNNLPNAQALPFDMGMFMTITYLVMAVIYFFPVYYLFKFSKKMKLALFTKNDETLSDSLELLKSHYKFLGVFTIIILSLYALGIIISLMGVALS